ncbi:M13 family peptidase [Limosilactobacillus mucosae]|uniref:M13 family metallopeptidase n=1 Tax=Limosilactobacillus mucosae TaxID=97478 RepID=UPI00233E95BD|nr:M13-type metalloendopeptidase [Limosilactobacillus mucosae]MDC2836767.1 M13 family peptidase [Limosilactobacillus mucosae]MDC2848947.1 M13 family peptidase [Limosilactobacillus mucosae]MDC2853353.1 M13 family peptidase [Limosilactobacillus mucosae]
MTIDMAKAKEDLYEAVNGEWLQTAQIPADRPATGGFNSLVDDIDKTLMDDFDAFLNKQKSSQDPRFNEMIKLYGLAKDFKRREQEGTAPLKKALQPLESLQSYADYQEHWAELLLNGTASPVVFDIDADMKNARVYALFAGAPSLILPEKNYYDPKNPQGPQLMQLWTSMMTTLLDKLGYEEKAAQKLIEETKRFDALLVPHVKSAEESADYSKMYNPQPLAEFAGHTSQLDLAAVVEELVGAEPDKVIVTEPKYLEALDQILAGHFEWFKSWLLVNAIRSMAGLLTDKLREINGRYSRALSGAKQPADQRKFAYRLARGTFDQVVGDYYGKTYFGPQAKADVHHMVEQMVKIYQQRLAKNDWLSEKTRTKAVLKLDKLGIQVGYPDQIPALYDQLKVDAHATLLENMIQLGKIATKEMFGRWNQPVDRLRWEMSAATVNAYYHPFKNIIVFPAAILQAPFYSLKQTSSENYGGIGAVIAHEISHAFDNNGALFDEYGNLNNWWTKADLDHFKQLAQKMIAEFDGLPFAGQKVNGKLTVSENIADAGGLSCALAAAKEEKDFDAQRFFINWARIWRMKATEQYMQLLLSIDVHSPNKLRANVQAQNQDEFYQAFNVQVGDGMYLAPDKRVNIW